MEKQQYEIFWKGQVSGPFPEEKVRELLRAGQFGVWAEIRPLNGEWMTIEAWRTGASGKTGQPKRRRKRFRVEDKNDVEAVHRAEKPKSTVRLKRAVKESAKPNRSNVADNDPEDEETVSVVCFKGPDFGSKLVLGPENSSGSVGRDTGDPIQSRDPSFSQGSVFFQLNDDQSVSFESVNGPECFLEGVPTMAGAMQSGQQLRIGGSYWLIRMKLGDESEAEDLTERKASLLDSLSSKVSQAAGVEKIEGFQLGEVMKDVFSSHSQDELERKFVCGTPETTPPLEAVEAAWPKPWLFVRMFFLSALICGGFKYGWEQFQNLKLIPGFLFVASFGIPVSTLILFWEGNILRNVSFFQVTRLVFFGGILSIIGSLMLFEFTSFHELIGAPSAGLIEEVGKVVALILLMGSKTRYPWSLNGMLFGAAIGCGFASFETAGYILESAFATGDLYSLAVERGVLSPFTHIVWTAAAGAALWRVKGKEPFSFWMLFDIRFLRVFVMVALLHAVWNFQPGIYFFEDRMLEYVFLGLNGLVGWLLILALYQSGLKEIQRGKVEQAEVSTVL